MSIRYIYCEKCSEWVEKDTCACIPQESRKPKTEIKAKDDDRTYGCDSCGVTKHISEMGDTMACECGGGFRMLNELVLIGEFRPYQSRELGAYVTSRKHEQKLLAEKGYSFQQDHYKVCKEAKNIRKHKEEHLKEVFSKDGLKYRPNSNTRFDITKKCFVDRRTGRPMYAIILLMLGMLGVAEAKIDMVEYTQLNVNGKVYEVPMANKDYVQDLYYLKKALKGDEEARDLFLGNNQEREFYIGDEYPRWLTLRKDGSCEVVEYPPNV